MLLIRYLYIDNETMTSFSIVHVIDISKYCVITLHEIKQSYEKLSLELARLHMEFYR